MSTVIIQLSEKDKNALDRRAAEAGMTSSAYLRKFVVGDLPTTAAEILRHAESHFGDLGLRIRPAKRPS